MKFRILCCLIFIQINCVIMQAQQVINLPFETPANIFWTGEENDYHSEDWNTRVITNVSKPSMIVYEPSEDMKNGVGVIVGPGGGMYAHSIESEGEWVADWLVKKGVTVFVLKYRLVPYQGDAVKAFGDPKENTIQRAKSMLPYAVADGLSAVDYVRAHADEFKLDINKVGFMGFSAGGAVTMGVTQKAESGTMPNFIVPVYPWMTIVDPLDIPENAPPMLVVCASDDPLGLAPLSVDLYNKWLVQNKSVALHMYAKGGHGFGMRTQNLATDNWIERFYEWLIDEGFLK